MALNRRPQNSITQDDIDTYARDGAVVLRGVCNSDWIDTLSPVAHRIAAANGVRLESRHCRNLAVKDLEGGNFIFIGGIGANPWVEAMQKGLAFSHVVDPAGTPSAPSTRPCSAQSPNGATAPRRWPAVRMR